MAEGNEEVNPKVIFYFLFIILTTHFRLILWLIFNFLRNCWILFNRQWTITNWRKVRMRQQKRWIVAFLRFPYFIYFCSN